MKKKRIVLTCLLLAVLLLAGCGRKKKTAETVPAEPPVSAMPEYSLATAAPAPAATPEGGFAIAPTQAPASTPAPTPAPTLAPAPTATPAPAPAATLAPVAANAPVIKKNPTGETVNVGGKCQFVTRYENAKWAVWHFVSPDGTRDIDYLQAAKEFPTLKIINGYGKDMTLDKIPAELNGWKVYCRFSNDSASADTTAALITVKGAGTTTGSGGSTAPSNPNAPVVTKDPVGETVAAGGKCQFVTRYENAKLAEWHFVSPDGTRDIDYLQAAKEFPDMKIIKGYSKDMTLDNIPAALNGWKVYCRFSNDSGATNTKSALITIKGQSTPTSTPAPKRQGFEGRWAEEKAGRCQIDFKYLAEGSMSVSISWSGSNAERACWAMTAVVSRSDIMEYNDGHYWVEKYTDDTHYTVENETTGGSGRFFILDGKLHWVDDQRREEVICVPV